MKRICSVIALLILFGSPTANSEYNEFASEMLSGADSMYEHAAKNARSRIPEPNSKNGMFLVVSKSDMTLTVYDLASTPLRTFDICCGSEYGDKQTVRDLRTPEGVFKVRRVEDSKAWRERFDNVSPDSRYIFFLDSDDLLYPEGLTKLVAAMESKPGSVMALGAIGLFSDNLTGETSSDSIVPDSIISCSNGGITSGECLDEYLHSRATLTQKYLWNRIFRSDLIRDNHLRFDEKIHYKEDGLFVIQYLLCCIGPVVCLNELVYLYRQNPASAMGALNDMSKPWNPKIMTNLDAHGRILDELRYHRVSRRLILQEIHNTFGCRRWILRRVIGHRSGRRKATLTTLLKISRPVLTALF